MGSFNWKIAVTAFAFLVPLAFVSFEILNEAGGATSNKAEATGGGAGHYKFAAPLDDLMGFMDDVFYDMPKKLDAKKFKNLRRESNFLAEMGNLLTHVDDYRKNKQWQSLAESMKVDSLKMAAAAKKKESKKVKSLHAAVEKSCDSCHDKFRDN